MIIIRTNHDIPTFYLYEVTKQIYREAETSGVKVAVLEGEDINEDALRKRIKAHKPQIISFNGHGSDSSMLDNSGKEFINENSADVFKNAIVYALACSCLNNLGKAAVKHGCKAFVGYKGNFWIARSNKSECTPLRDFVARPILDASNLVLKELIKGKPVDEAIEKSHEFASKEILKLIYSKEPLAVATLHALSNNDSLLNYEGDGNARADF